ncbi:MAG: glycoside hydrolase family 127 protein [Clostridia bacterium]|nr:glycoside hydrolase family 127 protein [Clostridia bacterium]
MIRYKLALPAPGSFIPEPRERYYLERIIKDQLTDENAWRHFVDAFRTKADVADLGWRGEFWGKMMRGASLVYRCTNDAELYAVMEKAVRALLENAEPDGRISTYDRETECSGWDIWCRKYVLTGMLHFCDICKDASLAGTVLDAMERHLDCLLAVVGPGKKEITETSDFWLGVNSCSILEPVLDLYKRRPRRRFLDFARYIIETGGCSGGDLVALALEDKTPPYLYPENKAYETMSFFEGVLAYYEVTGEKKYLDAAVRFAEAVYRTDITLIGCAGCTHELFDNSAVRQTEYSDTIMQETCVTVTWMRLCARLFLLTGDVKYADRVERSAVNALYGSVNLYSQPHTMPRREDSVPALPFDSYSPLYMNRRGRGVGGFKLYDDGFFYGCCAAIGAAGLAVYPLVEALRDDREQSCELEEHRLGGKIAFTYGPYVLARDEEKERADIEEPVRPLEKDGRLCYELLPCEKGEQVRLILKTTGGDILLTDYASCGKFWHESSGRISVWLNG